MSSQTKLIKDILSIYDTILENKSLTEAPSSSDELLGGNRVVIPSDGAHAGQSGWQSGNAWDLKGDVGTPVYALADGVAETFHDYGQSVTKTDGKKLFGQSFTVKSNGNLPDIYYTHLQNSPITKGSEIKCGQLLGYIMDFPGSSFDHVHIGVESGSIRQFLNDDGTMKCAKGQKIGGSDVDLETTTSGGASSISNQGETKPDPLIMGWGKAITDFFGLKDLDEEKKHINKVRPTYSKKLEENINKIKNLLK
jgi:murein DD-endopeptidase MepM/ murein hydrolase activator NlpD